MCLPPVWVETLTEAGHEALHWSTIGAANSPDTMIMEWARTNGYVIFTHDIDFGTLLALTNEKGPSVIQIRTQDVTPKHSSEMLHAHLNHYQRELESGALIVIDEQRARVRLLPIR
jgi:predicted nuclease of predicted toxin-antitoxin system